MPAQGLGSGELEMGDARCGINRPRSRNHPVKSRENGNIEQPTSNAEHRMKPRPTDTLKRGHPAQKKQLTALVRRIRCSMLDVGCSNHYQANALGIMAGW